MGPSPFLRSVAALLALPLLVSCGEVEPEAVASAASDVVVSEVPDAGFLHPVGVVVDTVSDVYLVSNVAGRLGERDGSGFISLVSPEGEVLDLHWIRSDEERLALHSPRGMGIRGDSLFVADLDCVRIFHRLTGAALARNCIQGASLLSDVDVGPEGSIFVVDSGLSPGTNGPEASGTDAVYRLVLEEGRRGATLARSADLGHPTGIAVGSRGIFVTTSGTGEILRFTPDGQRTAVFPRSNAAFEGVVFLPDGGFAFTSRAEGTVFRVDAEGRLDRIAENLPDPRGVAYDPRRNRLLVPLGTEGRLLFLDLP